MFVLYFSAPQLPHLACFGHAVITGKLEVPLAKAARCVPGHPCCSTFWLAACQSSTVPFVIHALQYIARGQAGSITNRACVHGVQDNNDRRQGQRGLAGTCLVFASCGKIREYVESMEGEKHKRRDSDGSMGSYLSSMATIARGAAAGRMERHT